MVRLLLIWIWTGILIGSALANSKTISWGDLKDPPTPVSRSLR